MKDGLKIYDVEAHINTKLMAEEQIKFGDVMPLESLPDDADMELMKKVEKLARDSGEFRISVMDKAGIDYAHLSLTTPGAEYFPVSISRKIAEDYNNKVGEAIKNYPERLGGWMALCPDDTEWSLKEIDRAVDMGLWGWCCLSNIRGHYLDELQYRPILKKINDLGMPIYLHPNFSIIKEIEEFGYCLNGPSLGFTVDTQLCLMRMIHHGVFDEFPDLQVFLGHDGEGLPFYMNRVDTAWRQGSGKPPAHIQPQNQHEPSYYLKRNVLATTSGNFLHEALAITIKMMSPDKVLLATDFPYEDVAASVDLIPESSMMPESVKRALTSENAKRYGLCPIGERKA